MTGIKSNGNANHQAAGNTGYNALMPTEYGAALKMVKMLLLTDVIAKYAVGKDNAISLRTLGRLSQGLVGDYLGSNDVRRNTIRSFYKIGEDLAEMAEKVERGTANEQTKLFDAVVRQMLRGQVVCYRKNGTRMFYFEPVAKKEDADYLRLLLASTEGLTHADRFFMDQIVRLINPELDTRAKRKALLDLSMTPCIRGQYSALLEDGYAMTLSGTNGAWNGNSLLMNVREIFRAIGNGHRIRVNAKVLNPYAMVQCGGNLYLVATGSGKTGIRHLRLTAADAVQEMGEQRDPVPVSLSGYFAGNGSFEARRYLHSHPGMLAPEETDRYVDLKLEVSPNRWADLEAAFGRVKPLGIGADGSLLVEIPHVSYRGAVKFCLSNALPFEGGSITPLEPAYVAETVRNAKGALKTQE